MMNTILRLLFLVLLLNSCKGQAINSDNLPVGGPCQDCEAALDYKILNLELKSIDSLPGYTRTNPKMKVSGVVYHLDGETPAEDIILYVYHTNRDSIYEPSDNSVGWEKRHGQHRGWVKTDANGKYTFYTFRPTPYPAAQESEHIHMYIKEPNKIPYYIDNYVFSDDPILNMKDIKSQKNRGGSGLVQPIEVNGLLHIERDIVLGLNIPNYK